MLFSQVIKIKNPVGQVSFELAEGTPFFELNGRLFQPAMSKEGNVITLFFSFQRGDVVGAYIKLPINQPDQFNYALRDVIISKVHAKAKQVELNSEGGTSSKNNFTLFDTYNNIIREFVKLNPGKQYKVLNIQDQNPIAVLGSALEDSIEEANTEYVAGRDYLILDCSVPDAYILNFIDDPADVSISEMARFSLKRDTYSIYRYSPRESFTAGKVYRVPDDYIEFMSNSRTLQISKKPPEILSYADEGRVGSTINPRFSFDTNTGLIDNSDYLVSAFEENSPERPKKYTGQLPTLTRPVSTGQQDFLIKVYTRHPWNHQGIFPALPEIAEYVLSDSSIQVSQVAVANYYVTTYRLTAVALQEEQKLIWRYSDI